jgi:uncharacterized protein
LQGAPGIGSRWWYAWALGLLLASAPLRADPVDWLYDVRVPVADQSPAARVDAAGRALAEVLTRVTGLASVPRSDAVMRAMAAPDHLYSQFGYERADDGDALLLRVQFVPGPVLDLVREARLPVWRASRPQVLAWVVVEDDAGDRQVQSAGSEHPVADGLRERARERGLPLQLPVMDLDDQLAVDPAAVWGRLSQALEAASARYGADIVLVGRLQQLPDQRWAGSWEFWLDGDIQYLNHEARDAAALGRDAADLVSDELAARYAVQDRGIRRVDLAVSALTGPGDYAELLRYLGGLEFVDELAVTEVAGDRVRLALITPAEPEQLKELFRLDRRLFPNSLSSDPGVAVDLVWQRR